MKKLKGPWYTQGPGGKLILEKAEVENIVSSSL
jgi:hypothetical protein